MDAFSITDVISDYIRINKLADELIATRQHYVDLRLQANDDIHSRHLANAESLDAAQNERETELVNRLNDAIAYADELMGRIEGFDVMLTSRITGLFADDQKQQYHAEAKRAADAQPLAMPANVVNMFDPLESIHNRLVGMVASGSPSMLSAHKYYVELFTMIEQARAYRPRLQESFERIYQNWLDEAEGQTNGAVDAYQSEFDEAIARINEEENIELDRWLQRWSAANADNPPAAAPMRSWPAHPKETMVRLSVAGYAGNEDLAYVGMPQTDPDIPVALDDSLVLWTQGDYRALLQVEDQFWWAFSQVRSYDYRISICSGGGAIDQSPELIRLVKRLPEVAGGKVVTDSREIADVLRAHVAMMDDTLQNKLPGYSSVQEFNEKHPAKPIPWRILYISHFPAGFDDAGARNLISLIRQGSRAGIRVIVQGDSVDACHAHYRDDDLVRALKALPHSFSFEALSGAWLNTVDSRLSTTLPAFERSGLSACIEQAATQFQENRNKAIDLLSIVPRARFQRCSSAHRLSLPIGMRDDGQVCTLEMGDVVGQGSSHFALVVGPTGSGKSVLLHSIIMAALASYPPSELELHLLDFKEGTEFKAYADIDLPQVRTVALDSMQQFGESVFARLTDEMNRRADVFKRASGGGRQIANIAEYRDAGGKMPRILVVVDEFQELFDCNRDRKCATRAAARFAELISKGRAFGIHMVFATQTLHHLFEGNYSIAKSSLEEMHIRIGLKCSEREYANLMGQDVASLCVQKNDSRKGSAVFSLDYVHDTPVGIRVAYLEPGRRNAVLRQVEKVYAGTPHARAKVFCGSDDVLVTAPMLAEVHAQRQRLYVGQPVAIGKNVGMDVSPQSASNMLVLGEDQSMLSRIHEVLLCQMGAGGASGGQLFLFDGAAMHAGSAAASLLKGLQDAGAVSADVDHTSAQNAFRVLPLLREAYGLYERRRNALASGTADTQSMPPVYLAVFNYQQVDPIVRLMEGKSVSDYESAMPADQRPEPVDALQSMLDSLAAELEEVRPIAASGLPPQKMLRTLLESGHLCNFHCVFTCASSAVLGRLLRSDTAPFNYRIVLPQVGNAYNYVETDINLKYVRENCVLYSDGTGDAVLVRPFKVIMPEVGAR